MTQSFEDSLLIEESGPEQEDVFVFPASFAQQRLWFLDQFEPGSPFYNIPMAVRLRGRLDLAALEQSLNEVVRRHEILRTTFAILDEQPSQLIAPELTLRLELIDLCELPESERAAEVQRLSTTEAHKPFDLAVGPLLRSALIRLGPDEHVLLFTTHHIVSDGWSIGILIREVATLYAAYSQGQPSPLAELPIQYADYAHWQREWLQGEVLDEQLAYWRDQLRDAPALLELPTDRPRPAIQTHRGAVHSIQLSRELSEGLKALSQREGVTLFMTLLAAFQTLLYRYSGQEDIVVGSPIAGRNRAEVEQLIGFFANTLVLRSKLEPAMSFSRLLARVREVALGAYGHQDVPFEMLVDELQPERSLSHSPLFQVMFILQNAPVDSIEVPGLGLRSVGVDIEIAKFDLNLAVLDAEQGLGVLMRYNTDLFNASTIHHMLSCFQVLLEGITSNPEQHLSHLPLLSADDRHRIIAEWNQTHAEYADESCIHHLFEAQVARTPEAVAIVCGDEQLTYRELNRRANQLAQHLRRMGVGPEVLVAILTERSLEMAVAILGTLKAGGAYLPLDLNYPPERLRWMMTDSGAGVVLTQGGRREGMDEAVAVVVSLDEDWGAIAAESEDAPESAVSPENLAYVIYTSGSTGLPKGVLVTHRSVVNHNIAIMRQFGLRSTDRCLQFHSISFDAAVEEFFPTWMSGGTLVLQVDRIVAPGSDLLRLIARHQLTILNLSTSYWHEWVNQLSHSGGELPGCLRLVIVGGEKASMERYAAWSRLGTDSVRWVNTYGPTEATITATVYEPPLSAEERELLTELPIGKPIANARMYILDPQLQPVPVGVAGELHIGGAGLARGYHNRAEQTVEKFIPDPFSGEAGARLYRSGDLARFLPTGDIQYLGRVDTQVKIRGFRIELGEIEAALSRHEAIGQAVADAVDAADEAGDKRLIAYLVSEPDRSRPSASELRTFLARHLPDYMLPALFIWLEQMPLTASGKIDRRALPAPDQSRPALSTQFRPPVTPLEEMLARMWQQALGVERVGLDDNFFELGGDSIRAAVFINKLQQELDAYVYVVAIFDAPTIASLAAYLMTHYTEAVAHLCTEAEGARLLVRSAACVDEAKMEEFRRLIPRRVRPQPRASDARTEKNRRAVFLLSPPRSGSTLLRVMLGGHSKLFAPPELELLSFETLEQRRAAFEGRDNTWLEGTLRALMQLRGCTADEARAEMQGYEQQGLSTREFYGILQDLLGERLLVDKTVSYALDTEILRRGEEEFTDAFYVHLLRHPYAMIRSFEEAKLDQVFFRYQHPFSRRELAELIWLNSHRNIEEFLAEVPAHRQIRVVFEKLVKEPRRVMEDLSEFLGLQWEEGVLEPYREKAERMTDGIHPVGKMLGDVKFHEHAGIDEKAAQRWREQRRDGEKLSEATWEAAQRFGYELEDESRRGSRSLGRLKRVSREAALPLSFAQQRLWVLDRLEPGSTAYNIPVAVRLRGRLDVEALERTFTEIIRRHESLRTTFATVDGQPVQVISAAEPINVPVLDLSGLAEAEREQEARKQFIEDGGRPFDLERGPLVRVKLLRLSEEEHVLLWAMHHIISDAWSLGVLVREVATLYEAYSTGQASPLAELSLQYADYASWQREWLQGEVLEEQLSYWREQLRDLPAVLDLPTAHSRPAVQTFNGAHRSLLLNAELTHSLKALSQREGVTLFMTLLAAFQTLLYRYSGQEDIAVGSPIAGRNRAELEPLIGFFINPLVLRTKLSGELSFSRLLGRVREVALGALAHQDVPFEKLVEELQPERSLSHSPLFQVMFALQNEPREEIEISGLKMNTLGGEGETAKFDLTLSVTETGQSLVATLEHNTDLFDDESIQRMLQHFERLLTAAVSDPDQRLSQLPLLSDEERHQLTYEWNNTALEYPHESCIHQLFESQAAQTPLALALSSQGHALSYAELNQRANQLAHHLQSLGIGSESIVAILLDRSLEMVISILAVLKAGAAYLPLDPQYPQHRLSFMIEDAAVSVLITQQQLLESLDQSAMQVICLDSQWDVISKHSERNPASTVTSDNLAYVIYTSGSTGTPKGVELHHRGLLNLVSWHQQQYSLSVGDRASQVAAQSFDASVWELWPYLSMGASVHLPERETVTSAEKMMRWLSAEQITHCFLPTVMAEAVMGMDEEEGSRLKYMLTGGDVLRVRPQEGVSYRVVNHYGPTECTVVASSGEVMAGGGGGLPSIGKGIGNTQVYILDEEMQAVPVGVSGELYIGGDGVARGYLNRPELTSERFLPDPFSTEEGRRLYRTGDVARYLPTGEVEYVGRRDQQVKVRGYRIEVGEIEAVLSEHDSIREAVVVAREDTVGDKRLVAYVVGRDGEGASASELRGYLREKLPEYMVPAAFVLLAEIPLMPNGKVDQRALPALDEATQALGQAYVGPRDIVEAQLVQIWERLLGVAPIGVTDSFFDLGGHSLVAVRLMGQVKQRFGQDLPLATLFQRATVEELAGVLRYHDDSTRWSSLVEIQRGASDGAFFFIHPVGGTVLCYRDLAHRLGPGQTVYGLQARGLHADQEPSSSIEEMATRYLEEVRAVQPVGPYYLGGSSMGGVIAFEMARQLEEQGHEVALLAMMDSWAPAYILDDERDETLLAQLAGELALNVSADHLSQLAADEQLNYILEQAKLARVIPPDVGMEQARRLLHLYKAHHSAIRTYVPRVNPCRIILFRAAEKIAEADDALGWAGLAAGGLEIYEVPGNHYNMIREPHVAVIAEQLWNCLHHLNGSDHS